MKKVFVVVSIREYDDYEPFVNVEGVFENIEDASDCRLAAFKDYQDRFLEYYDAANVTFDDDAFCISTNDYLNSAKVMIQESLIK